MGPGISENTVEGAIAIVGMGGRVPGAKDLETFWENQRDGLNSITRFTDEQLLAEGIPPEALQQRNYVKARAVLEDIDMFDAGFFGFSPHEAACMDPQNRLFMECVWEAIENAGYDAGNYDGAISVYAGARVSSYWSKNLYVNPETVELMEGFQAMLFNNPGFLTTAIAYKFDLKGPCYTLHTFCSTSLVAVHVACQSLLNFECDMAVAGGVAITVPQIAGYWYHEGLILSPDGHCRPFDRRARGTVFGNGLGAVVLKRLEDALADGDHIEAIILGSATNNDGSQKAGYGAPGVKGQTEVIVEAMANADVEPETIGYVEAHGTGTALGDPAEVSALTQAFRAGTQRNGFCALGSVKANVGHLDTAAGVTGLIRTVLALKHRTLPPSRHVEEPNPDIDFENSPFYINREALEWKSDGAPRRAGVSSFGIGGTNAHVILEEAPKREPSGPSRPLQVVVLSARTESALDTATSNLCKFLGRHPETELADAAYTLCTGRKVFNQRRYAVCEDVEDAVRALECSDSERLESREARHRDPEMVFLFPDEGLPYPNMGRILYEQESVFRDTVDACSEVLQTHLGKDLRKVLYPTPGEEQGAKESLCKASFSQPALFTLEYSLTKLWNSWGLRHQAALGCGAGEYVAACLSGVWPLEDALRLVAMRGRTLEALAGESISQAQREGLITSVAEEFDRVGASPPKIPLLSSLTGTWMTPEQATDSLYWARQMREGARVAESVETLWEKPGRVLFVVGPETETAALIPQRTKGTAAEAVILSLRKREREKGEWNAILHAVGQLWLRGVSIDWNAFYGRERRHRVALPTYPFERKRFWVESPGGLRVAGRIWEERDSGQDDKDLDESSILDLLMMEDTEARRRRLVSMVKELLEENSGLDPAEMEESRTFLEMGLDSLFLTRWAGLLRQRFNVAIEVTELLDGLATVGRLADFLEKELAGQYGDLLQEIDGMSDEEAEQLLGKGEKDD